ncbi:MAG TPA: YsnF/AvaK domain-containing protein, partial [Thermomonospora sp.]|nr:YsnF/AvaK domain-containing protein [Thermomonospora sp.]
GQAPQARDDAMTRSEERLRISKETRESGRARLRKYVVTERQQTTIPVSHEEVRLVREPITDENRDAAMSGPEISEAEHQIVLHEERVVVSKETVPVERVRADKQTVTEQRTVAADVRKERIELEGDTGQPERGRRR